MAGTATTEPKRWLATALLLLAVTATPGPAQEAPGPWGAEDPEPEAGPSFEASILGGVLAPLANLTDDPDSFGTAVTAAPALGAEVAVWLGGGFGVGLQGLWASADLQIVPTEFQGAIPTELGGAEWLGGTLSLLYRPALSGAAEAVQPFFGLGAGLRHLDVDTQAGPEVEDATDLVGTVAAGAHVPLVGPWRLRLEARDFISSFSSPTADENRLQNDLAVSVGASVRVR